MDPRIRQQYLLYMHQQQQRQGGTGQDHLSPTQSSQNHVVGLGESPRVPPPHLGPVPKVCVTSHENDPPEVNYNHRHMIHLLAINCVIIYAAFAILCIVSYSKLTKLKFRLNYYFASRIFIKGAERYY